MKTLRWGADTAATLLSPLLLFLTFPNPLFERGLPFLAVFGLAPLFHLLLNSGKIRWLFVPVAGILTYLFVHFWLYTFNPLAMIFVCAVMAFAYLALTATVTAVRCLFGESAYWAAAAAFAVFEFFKTVGFLAFPYGISGYSQYSVPGMRDIASVFGVFAVSFPLAFTAAFAAAAAAQGSRRAFKAFIFRQRKVLIAFALLFSAALVCGTVQTALRRPTAQAPLHVLAVQHSGDTWTGGLPTYRRNYEILKRLTERALVENEENGTAPFDLILWPETAFVPGIEWHSRYDTSPESKELVAEFLEWAKQLPCTFVTGNSESCLADPSLPPLTVDADGNSRLNLRSYNAAVVLNAGAVQGSYRKRHLVPIVESFPWAQTFPRAARFLEANGCQLWSSGYETKVFQTDSGVPFAVNICYEDVFAEIARGDARNGARLLVNLTNDSWSATDSAQMQHFAIAVFRALETGLPLVRATNSGTTALILPDGTVAAAAPPFVKTVMTAEVPLYRPSRFANAFLLREAFPITLIFLLFFAMLYKAVERILLRKKTTRNR